MAWSTQPVLVLSAVLGIAGEWKEGELEIDVQYWNKQDLELIWLLFFLPLHSAGPLFVLFGPGTEKSQQERINWPTHYRSEQIFDPSSL